MRSFWHRTAFTPATGNASRAGSSAWKIDGSGRVSLTIDRLGHLGDGVAARTRTRPDLRARRPAGRGCRGHAGRRPSADVRIVTPSHRPRQARPAATPAPAAAASFSTPPIPSSPAGSKRSSQPLLAGQGLTAAFRPHHHLAAQVPPPRHPFRPPHQRRRLIGFHGRASGHHGRDSRTASCSTPTLLAAFPRPGSLGARRRLAHGRAVADR